MSDSDVSKMKVADLKKELKARGLSVIGNKNELVDRLQTALLDGGDVLEDTANSEDLLDDELNDDLLDEDKDLTDPVAEEEQILKSPTPSETSKSISPDQPRKPEDEPNQNSDKSEAPAATPRKISLKRNISITKPTLTSDATSSPLAEAPKAQRQPFSATPSSATNSGSDGEPEKKVVKLGQLTALERLEMRAKKFGATKTGSPPSSTAAASATTTTTAATEKMQARAARFGLTGSGSITATSNSTPASLDALKKRAERFGCSVSSEMSKLEQEEKLAKRQARFGQSAATTGATASNGAGKVATASVDYAEKARLRLERFKSAA